MNPTAPYLSPMLLPVLEQTPDGISEYDLIKLLKRQGGLHQSLDLSDPLQLFQGHFLLFNQLYMLRDELRKSWAGDLEITASRIRLRPYRPQKDISGRVESLRKYYLNWENFYSTGRNEVLGLLENY